MKINIASPGFVLRSLQKRRCWRSGTTGKTCRGMKTLLLAVIQLCLVVSWARAAEKKGALSNLSAVHIQWADAN